MSIPYLFLALFIFVVVFLYLSIDPLAKYKRELNIEKAALVYSENLDELRKLVLPVRSSVFFRGDGPEPVVWVTKNENRLFLAASRKFRDLRVNYFIENLEHSHIVLDSIKNDSYGGSPIDRDKLPKNKIDLEGDFPNHFSVYCNDGEERLTLQVFTPDIMSDLVDNLNDVDIEILDGQVAMFIKGGAKNKKNIKSSLVIAEKLKTVFGSVKRFHD